MRRALVVLLTLALVMLTAVWLGLLAWRHASGLWDRVTEQAASARDGATGQSTDRAGGGRWRGVLGVEVLEATPELRRFLGAPQDLGVLVAAVADGSPAAAAGLAAGDVVTRIADRPVRVAADLRRRVAVLPGAEVALELYRRGERHGLTIKLGQAAATRPLLRYRDGDLFDLAERVREIGDRAGILGELGGVADGVAKLDPEAVARALDDALGSLEGAEGQRVIEGVDQRLKAIERRLRELEGSGRTDEETKDEAAGGDSR